MAQAKTEKKGGRRQLAVSAKKAFALRLYSRICECYSQDTSKFATSDSPFEWFKRRLTKEHQRRVDAGDKMPIVDESTVRGWLPPLEKLDRDRKHGSKVLERDWEALRGPDLPQLLEVAQLLGDTSLDYLVGKHVSPSVKQRMRVGKAAEELVRHAVEHYKEEKRWRLDPVFEQALAEVLSGQIVAPRPIRPIKLDGPNDMMFQAQPLGALAFDLGLQTPKRQGGTSYRLVVPDPQPFLDSVFAWALSVADVLASVRRSSDPNARRILMRLLNDLKPDLRPIPDDALPASPAFLRKGTQRNTARLQAPVDELAGAANLGKSSAAKSEWAAKERTSTNRRTRSN